MYVLHAVNAIVEAHKQVGCLRFCVAKSKLTLVWPEWKSDFYTSLRCGSLFMPLIPALGMLRPKGSEFKAGLDCMPEGSLCKGSCHQIWHQSLNPRTCMEEKELTLEVVLWPYMGCGTNTCIHMYTYTHINVLDIFVHLFIYFGASDWT